MDNGGDIGHENVPIRRNRCQPRATLAQLRHSSSPRLSTRSFVTVTGLEAVRELRQRCQAPDTITLNYLSLTALTPGILHRRRGRSHRGPCFDDYQQALSKIGWKAAILSEKRMDLRKERRSGPLCVTRMGQRYCCVTRSCHGSG